MNNNPYETALDIFSVFPNAWGERYRKANTWHACVACGKATSSKGESLGAWVVGGGSDFAPANVRNFNDGGDMGWFPIGNECIKKLPAEYRDSNPYENKVLGV